MDIQQKIIAIGGGEIGRSGYSVETTAIDKEIILLTSKANPRLLFFPTASGDSSEYFGDIKKHFSEDLGCSVDAVFLVKEKPILAEVKSKIDSSDIIYIGGGNTLRMMKTWRRLGVDKLLIEAYKVGKVMAGVSAGAICWFKFGNSDSWKTKNSNLPLIKVKGLNLINALVCPHYDAEPERKNDLKKMMCKTSGVAVALDNCCAIEIIGDSYRVISSQDDANAYKVYWKTGQYFEEKIEKVENLRNIKKLLVK